MAGELVRLKVWEALKLHSEGKHVEALDLAAELARANPHSGPALNLAASLHAHASTAAWEERPPGCDDAARALVARYRRAAVNAYSAAARVAPNCVMTALLHAEALANDLRFADALRELSRVLTATDHVDPAVHHVVMGGSTPKGRKSDAEYKASALMEDLAASINNEIVPVEAAKLLCGDAAANQVRAPARHLSQAYPYSPRDLLLRVYIELEQAIDLPLVRMKGLLRGILALISDAADYCDCSLLIALFHAKVLFALDKFDESEGECRRALRIQEPTDPSLDDIPPALSVPEPDCDARKQLGVLLKQIIVVAALCWSSIQTTQHRNRVDRVISVRVEELQDRYDVIHQSAAKTISGAVLFLKNQRSWSSLICPSSPCDGKKFVDTESLWIHMRKKHTDELWNKLESVLGPDLYENASKDDRLLDGITLSQDSDQHDTFYLTKLQPMFESLLLSPSIGIQADPLVEMRQRKCREGAEILEGIKKKLRMLPEDILSTEFEEFCFAIQNLWLKLLETYHREVTLPLARSLQRIEMRRSIALSARDLGSIIAGANIDAVFGKVPAATDHQSGDNLQSEKLKACCADKTLKADEKCEESEVRVLNGNSGTMVDKSSSDQPTGVHGSVMRIPARIAEVELDKKGGAGQSVKQMSSTSSYQESRNIFKKNNIEKFLFILSPITRHAHLLLFVFCLLAVIPVSDGAKDCEPSILSTTLATSCVRGPDIKTLQCCMPLLTTIDETDAIDCLCSLSQEEVLVFAGFTYADLIDLYATCGGLNEELAQEATCEGPQAKSFSSTPGAFLSPAPAKYSSVTPPPPLSAYEADNPLPKDWLTPLAMEIAEVVASYCFYLVTKHFAPSLKKKKKKNISLHGLFKPPRMLLFGYFRLWQQLYHGCLEEYLLQSDDGSLASQSRVSGKPR